MNVNDLISAISTVGFPIVCCGVMFWQSTQVTKMHKEESEKWQEALTNNTLALQKLVTLMEKETSND